LSIPQNGDVIVSRAGNVELQIDAPLPPTMPAAAPPPPPAPAAVAATPEPAKAPEPPPAKPLTRLEKLRLAAQERQSTRTSP
jgi:hypothetical protein